VVSTVVKFRVNIGDVDGAGCFKIKLKKTDIIKFTNV